MIRVHELRASSLGPGRVWVTCSAALAAPWVPGADASLPCGALNARGRHLAAIAEAIAAMADAQRAFNLAAEADARERWEEAIEAYVAWVAGNPQPTHAMGSRGPWRVGVAS